jgi:hypothetical protein
MQYTRGLSFGDGFQFGCGFFVAWVLGSIILTLLVAILAFAAAMLGLGSVGALLQQGGGALLLPLLF